MPTRSLLLQTGVLVGLIGLSVIVARLWWVREMDQASVLIKSGHSREAVPRLELMARLGDTTAADLLGYSYAFGWGNLPINQRRADFWLARTDLDCAVPSSIHRCGAAEASISAAFRNGSEGAPINLEQARYWAERSEERAADHR